MSVILKGFLNRFDTLFHIETPGMNMLESLREYLLVCFIVWQFGYRPC